MGDALDAERLLQALNSDDNGTRDAALQMLGEWLRRLALRRMSSDPCQAEDCVQEAMSLIWRGRGHVRTPTAFLGYCAHVLNGVIVDTWRKKGTCLKIVSIDDLTKDEEGCPGDEVLADPLTVPVEDQVESRFRTADVIRLLMNAIAGNNLSNRSRDVVAGGYFEDKSDAELAIELGISRGNVYVIRNRDLARLRQDPTLLHHLRAWLE